MKAILPVFVVFLLLLSCSNGREESKTALPEVADSLLPQNYYKRFEGTIGSRSIVMHLMCTGDRYDGIYYFLDQGAWIKLIYDKDSSNSQSQFLYEYEVGSIQGNDDQQGAAWLRLNYAKGDISGVWTSADGQQQQPIRLKESYPTGSYRFNALSFSDSIKAYPERDSSPSARTSYVFPEPDTNDPAGQWLTLQVKKMLQFDSSLYKITWKDAIMKMNTDYFSAYREDALAMIKEETVSFLNYESSLDISIRYNDRGYIIFEVLNFIYQGGAHGNWGSTLYCYDVVNQERVSLKDILITDVTSLQPFLETAFRRQQGLSPSASLNEILFDKHLATTDNFFFTDKGIGFIYNPYEVAAYAMGQLFVFVSFEEIMPYLKPEWTNRMGIKKAALAQH